jgi:hypothetical protein
MAFGSSSLLRIALVTGLCFLVTLPSLRESSSAPTKGSIGGTVVATVPVGHHPFGVAYNTRNGHIYVTNLLSNTVSVISTTTD